MNFNYNISTGESTIDGSIVFIKDQNIPASFSRRKFNASRDFLTGSNTLIVSLNSQTMFEEEPIVDQANNENVFFVNEADFYVTYDYDNSNYFYFNDINIENDDNVIYDIKEKNSGAFVLKSSTNINSWETETIPDLISNIEDSPADIDDLFEKWMVFVNGQKVERLDSSDLDYITGKVFVHKKDQNTLELNQNIGDVFGQEFLKDQVKVYVNGMKQKKNIFLQLYTGISLIKTGIEAGVDDLDGETYTINL